MPGLRLVVVEDERTAREQLVQLLREQPDLDVVAACSNGRDAIGAIRALTPDLVLLDLEMPDLDGFGVIEAVGAESMPATIVVTAHDDGAVRAFDVRALDYLLKPFGRERLFAALTRARAHLEARREHDLARRVLALADQPVPETAAEPDRFVVKAGGRVLFVAAADLDWVESDGNYVHLRAAGRTHVVRETMASIERRLARHRFARVHRTRIVNLDRVRELRARGNGEYDVVLADGTAFRVGRAFRQELEEKLQRGR